MPSEGERVHVGVMAVDIVSYSSEFDEVQERLVRVLTQIVNDILADVRPESVVKLPTGDGIILVFIQETSTTALKVALRLHEKIRDGLINLPIRIGIHDGPALIVKDANDSHNIVGSAVNICQRVMDIGDAGQILLSESAYSSVKSSEAYAKFLEPLEENPVEVKHYLTLNVYRYSDGTFGNRNAPSKLQGGIGLRGASLGRSTDWRDLIATDRSLRMIDISMPLFGTPALLDKLEEMVVHGTEVRVLLLNPISFATELRSIARAYDTINELETTLEYVIKIVRGFRRRLDKFGGPVARRFDVRLFDALPTFSAFLTDDRAYVSFYVEHLSGSRGPFFTATRRSTASGNSSFYDCIGSAFESLWEERSISVFSDDFARRQSELILAVQQKAQEMDWNEWRVKLGIKGEKGGSDRA